MYYLCKSSIFIKESSNHPRLPSFTSHIKSIHQQIPSVLYSNWVQHGHFYYFHSTILIQDTNISHVDRAIVFLTDLVLSFPLTIYIAALRMIIPA